MLMVHVPPSASGVVTEYSVSGNLYRIRVLAVTFSAVICSVPAPEFVTVTTLVTGARGVEIAKVSNRAPKTVDKVPLVAAVKLNAPTGTPVPVSITGEPVTPAPVSPPRQFLTKSLAFHT